MILYITHLMAMVALIPKSAHGDLWSKPRLSKYNGQVASASHIATQMASQITTSHITNDVPPKPLPGVPRLSQTSLRSSGWVEMDAKIDMRAVIDMLEEIPEILHVLRNMSDKVDKFDTELFLGSIISNVVGLKDSMGSGFFEVNKIIHDLLQGLHDGPLDATQKKLLQILDFLESNSQRPAQCELSEIEHSLQSVGKSLEDTINQLHHEISAEFTKGEQGMAGIRENGELLLRILSVLDNLDKKAAKGFAAGDCQICQMIQDLFKIGKDQSTLLHGIVGMVQGIPREIAAVLKADGGLGGLRKDIQTLLMVDEGIRGSLAHLSQLIEALNAKSDKFFSQNQKIIVETQYAVEETAKTIQKTASSTEQAVKRMVQEAARAGRALGKSCP